MKSHYAEYIFIFTVLVPHVWTEYSYICGKKSSNLQCQENDTIDITDVNCQTTGVWQYGCPTAEGPSCSNKTRLVKEKCNTKKNCTLSENDFKSCNKQPRRVFVKLYCTRQTSWWTRSRYIYNKTVEVCGSLSAIHCVGQDLISEMVYSRNNIEATCEVVRDINNCIENILHLCIGYSSCDHINVNTECFYLTLRAAITYSCNRGSGSPTTTVKNAGNQSYFDKEDVSPTTIVFDMTKPPNTDVCIKSIAGGASFFAIIIIFLLVIIYIQRRKLIKASYTTLTVRRDENNYNEIPHQMSDHIAEHNYEESPLSVIPTSECQSAAHQNIDQIQHVDTSGCLIPSNIMETGGDHYQSIAN